MSVVIPPRLPEPPEQIDRQYMEVLVRALQVFISQQTISNVENDAQAFSWFTE